MSARHLHRFRPTLMLLEDRTVPSAIRSDWLGAGGADKLRVKGIDQLYRNLDDQLIGIQDATNGLKTQVQKMRLDIATANAGGQNNFPDGNFSQRLFQKPGFTQ